MLVAHHFQRLLLRFGHSALLSLAPPTQPLQELFGANPRLFLPLFVLLLRAALQADPHVALCRLLGQPLLLPQYAPRIIFTVS